MQIFEPRDAASAARWLVLSLLLGAGMVAVTVPVMLATPLLTAVTVGVLVTPLAAAAAFAAAIRRGRHPGARSWMLVLLGSVALVVSADVVTEDATVVAQMFFLLPAFVAASQVAARGAWLTAALCCLGHLAVVLALLPTAEALVASVNVSAIVGVISYLLIRAGQRSDLLVAEQRRLAAVDPLTGLVTRRVLDTAAGTALAGPGKGLGVALAIIDLDHFKNVNDDFGHPGGDAALVHLATLITRVAGPEDVVSRLGGDELAVLLPDCSLDEAQARLVAAAELVRSTPLELDGGRVAHLTVSVGVAHSASRDLDRAGLYRAADHALYEAKNAGRDRVAVVGRGVVAAGPASADPTAHPAPSQGQPVEHRVAVTS